MWPLLCEHWFHIKCNNLNYLDNRYLQNCNESWHCIPCYSKIFPFNSLSYCTSTDSSTMLWEGLKSAQNSLLLWKPTPNLELLVNQFNNSTPQTSGRISSKYSDIYKMHNIEIHKFFQVPYKSMFSKYSCWWSSISFEFHEK